MNQHPGQVSPQTQFMTETYAPSLADRLTIHYECHILSGNNSSAFYGNIDF